MTAGFSWVFLSLLTAWSPQAFVVDGARVEVGDGTARDGARVVVDGGVIVDVLPLTAPLPAGVMRVEGRGKVLSPGLCAVGSQVGLFEVGMEPDSDDADLEGGATPGFVAGRGYNPRAVHVAVDREEGVTSAVLSPAQPKLFAGMGTLVSLSGRWADGPDLGRPVAMFGAVGGAVANAWGGSRGGLFLALDEIVDDVRWYRKNRAAYDAGAARPLRLSPVHLRALSQVVDGGGLPFIVRVNRASDILAVLDAADRYGMSVIIDGGAEAWLVADRLKEAKTPVIVHPSTAGELELDSLSARDDLATVLYAAGIPLVIATWATDMGTTRLRQEAGIAVQNGLPHEVALAAITSVPAALLMARASEPRRGLLAKGARADLVLWSGDPLEALTVAERVWIAGREETTPSRPRQLAERYRPRR
jgi:imidazolonepropionase-like amidohydrolase